MKPSKRALFLLVVVGTLALAPTFLPATLRWWVGVMGLVSLLLLIDGILAFPRPRIALERGLPQTLPLGVWTKVALRLDNLDRRTMRITVHDFFPTNMEVRHMPALSTIAPSAWRELVYAVRPRSRGAFWFEPTQIQARSPLGLWERSLRQGPRTKVRVYPNFREVSKYNLLATSHHLAQLGIRKKRRRGEGKEFHQLREYLQGDALRQIDWKTSSRMRKLISREYQDERDQQIFFLIDCGRGMRAQDGELSHFDHALNAILLLSKVALSQGDAVGLATFSGENRMLAPRKGVGQLNVILNTLFDIQPTLLTSDFMEATRRLLQHLKKRSLLIFVTNLRDEDQQELAPALKILSRKHLVLMASMRERILEEILAQPVLDFQDSLRVAATLHYLSTRQQALELLKRRGILCLDVEPTHLAVASVNSYLDIKRKGLL